MESRTEETLELLKKAESGAGTDPMLSALVGCFAALCCEVAELRKVVTSIASGLDHAEKAKQATAMGQQFVKR